jgi:hypothetical protein
MSYHPRIYRQFIETESSMHGGEWKAYPTQCAYLPPGEWHHVALSFGSGKATLYMDGRRCAESGGKSSSAKVNFTGLTQNLQADPWVCCSSLAENSYKSHRVDPDSGSTL